MEIEVKKKVVPISKFDGIRIGEFNINWKYNSEFKLKIIEQRVNEDSRLEPGDRFYGLKNKTMYVQKRLRFEVHNANGVTSFTGCFCPFVYADYLQLLINFLGLTNSPRHATKDISKILNVFNPAGDKGFRADMNSEAMVGILIDETKDIKDEAGKLEQVENVLRAYGYIDAEKINEIKRHFSEIDILKDIERVTEYQGLHPISSSISTVRISQILEELSPNRYQFTNVSSQVREICFLQFVSLLTFELNMALASKWLSEEDKHLTSKNTTFTIHELEILLPFPDISKIFKRKPTNIRIPDHGTSDPFPRE